MTETVTFTFGIKPEEYALVRNVINNGMGGIRLNRNKISEPDIWQKIKEDYYIEKTKTNLFYNGESNLTIKGLSVASVMGTRADLERSGVELKLIAV